MVEQVKFHGIIPPIPSVLYKDGTVDEEGQKNLIDFLIDAGVHGLFFTGSSGEFSQMYKETRKKIAEVGIKHINRRVPVLVGTGTPNTLETIELSQHAKEIGADAVVLINPYYWKLTEQGLFDHYSEIASNVDLPIILYNFPTLTGQDLTPDFVYKLAMSHENIIGIKETVEDVGHIRDMIYKLKKARPEFVIFSGYDDHLLHNLATGGDGAIPLTSSFLPEASVGLYEAFQNKDYEEVFNWHHKLSQLIQLYQIDTPFVNVAKEAIKLRGVEISTELLPPLRSLNKEGQQEMTKKLKEFFPDFY
ncbi:dihydrodipicolinate synthase family protein [Oceanobacillus longus]|uniref:Dihydrodipicolinate synthase family protein n=1 Tax=Oceanobacillus longus TaxID=930120 RepID=A0ABV8GZ97_9BACI